MRIFSIRVWKDNRSWSNHTFFSGDKNVTCREPRYPGSIPTLLNSEIQEVNWQQVLANEGHIKLATDEQSHLREKKDWRKEKGKETKYSTTILTTLQASRTSFAVRGGSLGGDMLFKSLPLGMFRPTGVLIRNWRLNSNPILNTN